MVGYVVDSLTRVATMVLGAISVDVAMRGVVAVGPA